MAESDSALTFDYVIVGAGAAGGVLAEGLSQDAGVSVCVIESGRAADNIMMRVPAGFRYVVGKPRNSWNFRMAAGETVRREIPITQGRVLGGSTSVNGMCAMRGVRQDYDSWARMGADGWGYADLLPYFKQIERYRGSPSEYRGQEGAYTVEPIGLPFAIGEAFIAGAASLGMPTHNDYNGASQEGVSYTQMSRDGRFRVGTAFTYLKAAAKRGNVQILTDATVERIVFEGKRARGVVLRAKDGSSRRIGARREVVVSAGAINSARLLQVSGVGPAGLLRSIGVDVVTDRPVGENFKDHYSVPIVMRGRGFVSINQMARGPRLLGQLARWAVGLPSILNLSPAYISHFLKSSPDLPVADLQGFFMPGNYRPGPGRALDEKPGMTATVWQHRPYSAGYVRAQSARFDDPPVVQPNYLADERDQAVIVRGLRLLHTLLKTDAMRQYIDFPITPRAIPETDAEWLDHAVATGSTVFHPMGTARIGRADDPAAVVTADMTVIGTANLRVVDASTMPDMISGNLALPTIALASRACDIIRGRQPLARSNL